MADAAAARREARRKRILENSQNRLQLISGNSSNESIIESPVRTIPEPMQELSNFADNINSCSKTSLIEDNGFTLPEEAPILTPRRDNQNHDIVLGDGQQHTDLASFLFGSSTRENQHNPPLSFWEKVTNNEYDIVLLSIINQLLVSFSLVSFEGTYFFLPVLIYAITKLIWFPSRSNSKLSNLLALVQIISSYRVQKCIYITQSIAVISCNICIFLFTTICIQSLVVTLTDGLIT